MRTREPDHPWPGGHVKFSNLISAVAGVAICATAATAQVCQGDLPFRNGGTLSLGFGPTIDVGGASMHTSSQTLTLGASFGRSVSMSKTQNLLPFASVAFGHTRASAK